MEWAGASQDTFALESEETLGALAGRIAERWPKLGGAPGVRLAVNRQYAALDFKLSDGDEVAVIPPVSGG